MLKIIYPLLRQSKRREYVASVGIKAYLGTRAGASEADSHPRQVADHSVQEQPR